MGADARSGDGAITDGGKYDRSVLEGPAPPHWLLALELAYLVTLVGFAILYGHTDTLRRVIPVQVGPAPLAVPWWGALGGVTISLTGIFRNARRWDSSYNGWHIARPALGAVVGTVGYLVFIVVVRATGSTVGTSAVDSRAAFDLIAFLVGYREDIFRELLKRATDVLFATGSNKTQATPEKG